MAYIGKEPIVGNFQMCDAISVVNGQATYALQVGGSAVSPESSSHVLCSLNGILQKSGSSFSISSSNIVFASNLATGDVIDFVMLLGSVLNVGTVSDATITNAKLAQDIISGETALTSEPDSTDEFLISDSGTLKRVDYSLISNIPAFRVYMDGDQSISSGSTSTLEMDAETFDTSSAFNTTSYKFIVPSGGAGKYFFNFQVYVAGLGQILSQATLNWEENGSSKSQTYRPGNMDTSTRDGTISGSMITGEMVATDEAYLQCYVATTRTITGANSFFAGNKLIGA